MEFSTQLFEIVEDGMIFKGNEMILEISSDDEDGTYPLVSHYVRLLNRIDKYGASAWLNWGKRKPLTVDLGYCKVIRESKFSNIGKLVFDEPIKVNFGNIGNDYIIKEVTEIEGEFSYDYFWKNKGRQNKIPNGFEIIFQVSNYLK